MIEQNRALAPLTTIGIGGSADFFTEVHSLDEMVEAFAFADEKNLPIHLLGKGSNTLFDDQGFKGLVILNKIDHFEELEPGLFEVGAGFSFALFGVKSAKAGYTGFEFAPGIPASCGGAIFMNAGASGQETSTYLESVLFLDRKRGLCQFKKEELSFSYRHSTFHELEGAIIKARFRLPKSQESLNSPRKKQLSIIDTRTKSQPYDDKSAGCVFRNPEIGPAGRLIEESGLKGLAIGGAMVSSKHANFIVNKGGATAANILDLMNHIEGVIKERYNIDLVRELRTIPYDIR